MVRKLVLPPLAAAVYFHLTRNGVLVDLGRSVPQGDPIALSGQTGHAGISPHLHFGVLGRSGALFDGYHPRMREVHERNAGRLGAILEAHGWPGRSLAGEDASAAAWLVLQHAIGNPSLQRRGLTLMRAAATGAARRLGSARWLRTFGGSASWHWSAARGHRRIGTPAKGRYGSGCVLRVGVSEPRVIASSEHPLAAHDEA